MCLSPVNLFIVLRRCFCIWTVNLISKKKHTKRYKFYMHTMSCLDIHLINQYFLSIKMEIYGRRHSKNFVACARGNVSTQINSI